MFNLGGLIKIYFINNDNIEFLKLIRNLMQTIPFNQNNIPLPLSMKRPLMHYQVTKTGKASNCYLCDHNKIIIKRTNFRVLYLFDFAINYSINFDLKYAGKHFH